MNNDDLESNERDALDSDSADFGGEDAEDIETECLIAQFESIPRLNVALEALDKDGFEASEVSTVTSTEELHSSQAEDATDTEAESAPGDKATATTVLFGGTLGATLGAVSAVGPLLIAGPLAGLAIGALGGSLMSAMEGWGVDYDVASKYEQAVIDGAALVIVTTNPIRIAEAENLLQTIDPQSLKRYRI